MSVPYCAENVLNFYHTVNQISQIPLPSHIFEEDTTKFSRKITGIPFSILVLQPTKADSSKSFYILSNMKKNDSDGCAKIAYPLTFRTNIAYVYFNLPTAVKILTPTEAI